MPHDVAEMARTLRRPTSLPSPDGSCRLSPIPLENVSRSFDYSDRVTDKPEVIPADPIRIITSGLPTIRELIGSVNPAALQGIDVDR